MCRLICTFVVCIWRNRDCHEDLDLGGGGVWNSLISKKFSPLFSFFKIFAYPLKNDPLFFKILTDFRQFLYDSVEKVLFKAAISFFLFFFFFFA